MRFTVERSWSILQIVISVDAIPELSDDLMECYRQCTTEGDSGSEGVSMDAFFSFDTEAHSFDIVFTCREPKRFSMQVSFDPWESRNLSLVKNVYSRWREGYDVALAIYPTWAELERSTKAIISTNIPDFMSRGVFVEGKMDCHTLGRIEDLIIPEPYAPRDPVTDVSMDSAEEREAFIWWHDRTQQRLWGDGRSVLSDTDVSNALSQEARAPLTFDIYGRILITSLADLGVAIYRSPAWICRQIEEDIDLGRLSLTSGVYVVRRLEGQIMGILAPPYSSE